MEVELDGCEPSVYRHGYVSDRLPSAAEPRVDCAGALVAEFLEEVIARTGRAPHSAAATI